MNKKSYSTKVFAAIATTIVIAGGYLLLGGGSKTEVQTTPYSVTARSVAPLWSLLAAQKSIDTRNLELEDELLTAVNEDQRITANFAGDRVYVVAQDEMGDGVAALRTLGFGRRGAAEQVDAVDPVLLENKVVYERSGQLQEWFENSPKGIEQGWNIASAPAGDGELMLSLQVEGYTAQLVRGALEMHVVGHEPRLEEFVLLQSQEGKQPLNYHGLKVVDATGKELPSHFEVAENTISIMVDDAEAVYPIVVDPTISSSSATRTYSGVANFNNLGRAVLIADVGGTADPDLVIGVPGAAEVQIYYGNGTPVYPLTPDVTLSGVAGSEFGYALAANFITTTSIAQLVVGAPGANSQKGAVYAYDYDSFGSPSWSYASTITMAERFGNALAVGKTDADANDDLVIGAPLAVTQYGAQPVGKGYVYSGGGAWTGATSYTLSPATALGNTASQCGSAVAAGNIKGDADGEAILGCYTYGLPSLSNIGAILVYSKVSGSPVCSSAPLGCYSKIEGGSAGDRFGFSLAVGQIITASGTNQELLVGAPGAGGTRGAVKLLFDFFGNLNDMGNINGNPGSNLGYSLAITDSDGDGKNDIIAGAPGGYFGTATSTDQVRVYPQDGSLNPPSTVAQDIYQGVLGSSFGARVVVGNIDGNNLSDLFISAPKHTVGTAIQAGSAYLFTSFKTYLVKPTVYGMTVPGDSLVADLETPTGSPAPQGLTTVTSDGVFTFYPGAVSGYSYNVTAAYTGDQGKGCQLANPSGVASADITNIKIRCGFPVNVNVLGLEATESLAATLTVTAASISDVSTTTFASPVSTFPDLVLANEAWNVTIGAAPTGKVCQILGNSGGSSLPTTATVEVRCGYQVTTMVEGLQGLESMEANLAIPGPGIGDTVTAAVGVTANTFYAVVLPSEAWNVSMGAFPGSKTCYISGTSGGPSISADQTALIVCGYTVTVDVNGLQGGDNLDATLTVTSASVSELDTATQVAPTPTFASTVTWNEAWSVSLGAAPAGKTCEFTSASGGSTITGNTLVDVRCGYFVNATVAGLEPAESLDVTLNVPSLFVSELSTATMAANASQYATLITWNEAWGVVTGAVPGGKTCLFTGTSGGAGIGADTAVGLRCGYTVSTQIEGMQAGDNKLNRLEVTSAAIFDWFDTVAPQKMNTYAQVVTWAESWMVEMWTAEPAGKTCQWVDAKGSTFIGADGISSDQVLLQKCGFTVTTNVVGLVGTDTINSTLVVTSATVADLVTSTVATPNVQFPSVVTFAEAWIVNKGIDPGTSTCAFQGRHGESFLAANTDVTIRCGFPVTVEVHGLQQNIFTERLRVELTVTGPTILEGQYTSHDDAGVNPNWGEVMVFDTIVAASDAWNVSMDLGLSLLNGKSCEFIDGRSGASSVTQATTIRIDCGWKVSMLVDGLQGPDTLSSTLTVTEQSVSEAILATSAATTPTYADVVTWAEAWSVGIGAAPGAKSCSILGASGGNGISADTTVTARCGFFVSLQVDGFEAGESIDGTLHVTSATINEMDTVTYANNVTTYASMVTWGQPWNVTLGAAPGTKTCRFIGASGGSTLPAPTTVNARCGYVVDVEVVGLRGAESIDMTLAVTSAAIAEVTNVTAASPNQSFATMVTWNEAWSVTIDPASVPAGEVCVFDGNHGGPVGSAATVRVRCGYVVTANAIGLQSGETLNAQLTIPLAGVSEVSTTTFASPVSFYANVVTWNEAWSVTYSGVPAGKSCEYAGYNGDSSIDTAHNIYIRCGYIVTVDVAGFEAGESLTTNLAIDNSSAPFVISNSGGYAALGAPTFIALNDDEVSGDLPLGFSFDFQGNIYSTVRISSNGFLTFTSNANGCCSGNNIPNAADPNDMIPFWWTDMFPPSAPGTIGYSTLGVAPNRRWVMQYTSIRNFGNEYRISAQVSLYEGTNKVEIIYNDAHGIPGDDIVTIGWENASGTVGSAWANQINSAGLNLTGKALTADFGRNELQTPAAGSSSNDYASVVTWAENWDVSKGVIAPAGKTCVFDNASSASGITGDTTVNVRCGYQVDINMVDFAGAETLDVTLNIPAVGKAETLLTHFASPNSTYTNVVLYDEDWDLVLGTPPLSKICAFDPNYYGGAGLSGDTTVRARCGWPVNVAVNGLVGNQDVDIELESNIGTPMEIYDANGDQVFTFRLPVTDTFSFEVLTNNPPAGKICTPYNETSPAVTTPVFVSVFCGVPFTINAPVDTTAVVNLLGNNLVMKEVTTGTEAAFDATAGTYYFKDGIMEDGAAWKVVISGQPTHPNQTCTLGASPSGAISGVINKADATGPTVTCVTDQYFLSGSVVGLTYGTVTAYTAWDSQTVGNGAITFAAADDLTAYAVTIQTSDPNDICAITSGGNGTFAGAGANNLVISCNAAEAYTIGGTVSGLAGTNGQIIEVYSGQVTNLSADGSYWFAKPVIKGQLFNVLVMQQPTAPSQVCTVANPSGTVAGNITNADINCVTNQYTLVGSVIGLTYGQVNAFVSWGDMQPANNGTLVFVPTDDFTQYSVTVATTSTDESCVVTSGAIGMLQGSNNNDLVIECSPTAKYMIGGTVSGLAGINGQIIEVYSGQVTNLNADGSYWFANPVTLGQLYNVLVLTQPDHLSQTCTVANPSGTVAGNVSNVDVTCVTDQFVLSGVVSGLGWSTVTATTSWDSQTVGNGAFSFAATDDGTSFDVALATADNRDACTVTAGSKGTFAGADLNNLVVTCMQPFGWNVSAQVIGVAGQGLVLTNNNASSVNVNGDGFFVLASGVTDTVAYDITVTSQPSNPAQTCVVSNGSGTIMGANALATVTCTNDTRHTISVNTSGLSGAGLTLREVVSGQVTGVTVDGTVTFANDLTNATYTVEVAEQPSAPNQVCQFVGQASPSTTVTLANADVSVDLECTTTQYTLVGSVMGLTYGQVNAFVSWGDMQTVGNGTLVFVPTDDFTQYSVTVATTSADESCVVTSGAIGMLEGHNNSDLVIECSPLVNYTLGGTVTGLVGSGLQLQNMYAPEVTNLAADGGYTFTMGGALGGSYLVVVNRQPTDPKQTCTVANDSGVIAASVANIDVSCTTNQYTVGGNVAGLNGGGTVTLSLNNGAQTIAVAADGSFTFGAALDDASAYRITVMGDPVGQICSVADSTGVLYGSNVSGVDVSCANSDGIYTIGGTVSGLAGSGLQVRNSFNSEVTDLSADGSYSFALPLTLGETYYVTLARQPVDPKQTCTIANAGGMIAGNVGDIDIACVTNQYSVGGTVRGLQGGTVTLALNGSQQAAVSTDGSFTFTTALDDASGYLATVVTDPAGQACVINDASGVLYGSAVSNIDVLCTDTAAVFTIAGTVSGLNGIGLQLQNRATGEIANIAADGAYQFALPMTLGETYTVVVNREPAELRQSCSIANATGVVAGNVSTVDVTCSVRTYSIGGTVVGLNGSGLTVQLNGGFATAIAGNGLFDFGMFADGLPFAVSVSVQPTVPAQTCEVLNLSGVLAGAPVSNVVIDCANDDTDGDGLTDLAELSVWGTDLNVADTDGDNLSDYDEVYLYHTDPLNPDTDNDTINDDEEVIAGVDGFVTDPRNADTDNDGLRDDLEVAAGSDPTMDDTDSDGLGDYEEVRVYHTPPAVADADGDTLNDWLEVFVWHTDPWVADSDGDTLTDGYEVSTSNTDPLAADSDGDGLSDSEELQLGSDGYITNPLLADSDSDGLMDGLEDILNSNPNSVDTDGGGVADGDEYAMGTDLLDAWDDAADWDNDGLSNYVEITQYASDPTDPDSDNDGLNDGLEISYGTNILAGDSDGDTLLDGEEVNVWGTNPLAADTDGDTLNDNVEINTWNTNPRAVDSDYDGLRDDEELAAGADGYVTNPLAADTDGDGLGDSEEVVLGTDGFMTSPIDADSDNDGLSDGVEASYGSNPNQGDSDGDGIGDREEVEIYGTNINVVDSDGDTLSDGLELLTLSTDPLTNDTDHDTVLDQSEVALGTNPLAQDTDKDGLSDGVELGQDGNSNTYNPLVDFNPLAVDSDNGGIWDGQEILDGTDPLSKSDDKIDTDKDGITDWTEINVYGTDPEVMDTDGDGLWDSQEIFGYGSNPLVMDTDSDLLNDFQEATVYGSNVTVADTDGDTLLDGVEVLTYRTSPLHQDTDLDGADDNAEIQVLLTDPLNPDSDGDGLKDGTETGIDGNPNNYTPGVDYDPNDRDTDNGGIWDGQEVKYDHTDPRIQTDDAIDTDGDGIGDWVEAVTYHTNPRLADSDGDGIMDPAEIFSYGSDPTDTDTDTDDLVDGKEVFVYGTNVTVADSDGDTLTDGAEVLIWHTDPLRPDSDYDSLRDDEEVTGATDGFVTDPLRVDTDSDGVTDAAEIEYKIDPTQIDSDQDGINDGDEVFFIHTDPAVFDTDQDGIGDGEELRIGTDPLNPDTDGDGDSDGKEIAQGTDPLDSDAGAILAAGGGGCSATRGEGTFPLSFLIMLLPLVWVRLRRKSVAALSGALLLILVVPTMTQAAQITAEPHSVQSFAMPEGVGEFIVTDDSETLKQWKYIVGAGFNYTGDMMSVRNGDVIKRSVISKLMTGDAMFGLGFMDILQWNLTVPYHLYVVSTKPDREEYATSTYMGDIRSSVKLKILDRIEFPVGLAAKAFMSLPSGDEEHYLGEKSVMGGLSLLTDVEFKAIYLGLNLGFNARPTVKTPDGNIDDQLTYSLAAALTLTKQVTLIADIYGSTVVSSFFKGSYGNPLEGALALRTKMDSGYTLTIGGGMGVTAGIGAAPYRMFASLSWQNPDSDAGSDEEVPATPVAAKEEPAAEKVAGPQFNITISDSNTGDKLAGKVMLQPEGVEVDFTDGTAVFEGNLTSQKIEITVDGYEVKTIPLRNLKVAKYKIAAKMNPLGN